MTPFALLSGPCRIVINVEDILGRGSQDAFLRTRCS